MRRRSDEVLCTTLTAPVFATRPSSRRLHENGNVETSEQADALRRLGCDFAQGCHFGRPEEARVALLDA